MKKQSKTRNDLNLVVIAAREGTRRPAEGQRGEGKRGEEGERGEAACSPGSTAALRSDVTEGVARMWQTRIIRRERQRSRDATASSKPKPIKEANDNLHELD